MPKQAGRTRADGLVCPMCGAHVRGKKRLRRVASFMPLFQPPPVTPRERVRSELKGLRHALGWPRTPAEERQVGLTGYMAGTWTAKEVRKLFPDAFESDRAVVQAKYRRTHPRGWRGGLRKK